MRMPGEYLIDVDRHLVISRGRGAYGFADQMAHMKALQKDSRFRPDYNHLVDCRGFETFDLAPADIKALASQSVFAPTSRRACIVSSELHFGLCRIFATYRELATSQITQVFREFGEGAAWLGLPAGYDPSTIGKATPVNTPG